MINHLVQQRYEVVEKVGEGPLFVVYKARDRVSNQVVALKMLQPQHAEDTALVRGLIDSLRATGELDHPNIARYRDFGQDGSSPFIVSEFVRGINLKERIRRIAPFTLSVAIDFACGIAEALNYAHKIGQTHGDVRPHNVIISPEGALKVTDFGVQRAIALSPTAQVEMLSRSAPYHAPELSTTSPGTASGDIYALGAILYEMLTGTPLYAGESPEAIAEQHARAQIPSPRTISPGVPRSVEGIVMKCLQKRPEQRYATAADLLQDLKAVRDALRFGKSLSWSPMDGVEAYVPPSPVAEPAPAPPAPRTYPVPSRGSSLVAVPDAPVAEAAIPMSNQANRLRSEGERVSFVIRALLVFVLCVILLCIFGFMYIVATKWVVPQAEMLPQMEGKQIDEVRKIADKLHLRPLEHSDYMDLPRGTVYRTDPKAGSQTRPNHIINIWYSSGPKFVDVPNVVGMTKEDAEQKLTDTGLTVGSIMLRNSDTVPANSVIEQNVSFKKRVQHGQPVDLVISDGPKLDGGGDTSPPDSNTTPPNTDGTTPDTSTNGTGNTQTGQNPAPNPDDETQSTFDRNITIPFDHLGQRDVEISYSDSHVTDAPVISEPHNEGDHIQVRFLYYGKTITLTVKYDNKTVWHKTFDPQATRNQTVR